MNVVGKSMALTSDVGGVVMWQRLSEAVVYAFNLALKQEKLGNPSFSECLRPYRLRGFLVSTI